MGFERSTCHKKPVWAEYKKIETHDGIILQRITTCKLCNKVCDSNNDG